jgi:DNA invertase Pin-like site-specific DNA recombinase
MRKRLRGIGWRDVEVIDEDLGKSAAGTADRSGFERMVAEVCLGKVGAVAAREVSRFARNSRDWQQLVEVCRVVDTLLVDHETVYSPRIGNDRLLLGLKGNLNEYELDILRLRSVEARHQKARRGELIVTVPVGYLKTEDGRMEKDPDERVQEAIRLVFRKTLEFGAARRTLMWLLENRIDLPTRQRGIGRWETVWKRPTYGMVTRMLENPAYAGMYAYGRTEVSVEFHNGRAHKKSRRRPPEKWLCLLPDRHDGYIERDEFERVRKMMSRNAQAFFGTAPGAPKKGPALLAGLLRCRCCGRKLVVSYSGRDGRVPRYCCQRGALDCGESRCLSAGALDIDQAVVRQVLCVARPGAVQAAILAAQEAAGAQDEVIKALRLELDAARYAADRAWKQYDAADPENRLVAAELERRYNAALEKLRDLEIRIEEEETQQRESAPSNIEEFEALAEDLDLVWNDPGTDVRLKKRVIRALIEEIAVDVDPEAGQILLAIHWQGGTHTELHVRRRRRGRNSLHTPVEIVDTVKILVRTCTDSLIAGILNRNGLRTGHGNRWTEQRVTSLRAKRGIPRYSPERQQAEGWLNLGQAAEALGISPSALRLAAEREEIPSLHPLPAGPWTFNREDLDGPSGRAIVQRVSNRRNRGAVPAPDQATLFK